jgi:choline dehydrogenase-like flavoprotein
LKGGTSGSVLASRLANGASAPSVLLLEAGGSNESDTFMARDLRFLNTGNPNLDWGYKSVPQIGLGGKITPYHRGKGLGGSSISNYAFWVLGHGEDFNNWAEVVGDDCWKWEGKGGVKQRFRKIEKLNPVKEDRDYNHLWDLKAIRKHSQDGKLDISYPDIQEEESLELIALLAAKEIGVSCLCSNSKFSANLLIR